jgi:hypothetical protein
MVYFRTKLVECSDYRKLNHPTFPRLLAFLLVGVVESFEEANYCLMCLIQILESVEAFAAHTK